MNDEELNAFEKELAALRPREPSARLRAKLDAMVDSQAGDRPRAETAPVERPAFRWQRWAPWMAVAAGLAFASTVLVWRPFGFETPERSTSPREVPAEVAAAPIPDAVAAAADPEAKSDYRPVKALNSLRNRIDEGLVTLDTGLSARQYRFQFVDTVVWENQRDGSQFEVSTPREEIVLVPVHTF